MSGENGVLSDVMQRSGSSSNDDDNNHDEMRRRVHQEDDGNDELSNRRTTRASLAAALEQRQRRAQKQQEEKKQGPAAKSTDTRRSVVTPSPLPASSSSSSSSSSGTPPRTEQEEDDDDDDLYQKPAAAKRQRLTRSAAAAAAAAEETTTITTTTTQKRPRSLSDDDKDEDAAANENAEEVVAVGDRVYASWPANGAWYWGQIVGKSSSSSTAAAAATASKATTTTRRSRRNAKSSDDDVKSAAVAVVAVYDVKFDDGDERTGVLRGDFVTAAEYQRRVREQEVDKDDKKGNNNKKRRTHNNDSNEAAAAVATTATSSPYFHKNNNSNKPPAWVLAAVQMPPPKKGDEEESSSADWSDVGQALFGEEEEEEAAASSMGSENKTKSNKSKSNKAKSSASANTNKRKSKATSTAAAPKAARIQQQPRQDNEEESNNDSVNNDDDDLDRPFSVEYAPTGRATCRRCDERIAKGTVRVSHQPLFRGQPGFVVHRHLACAVFSETVTQKQHVKGWRKLTAADQKRLQQRLRESLVEVQQEQEELQPDELVQESFSGPRREAPPGLTATLLPFQHEGTSWMYCQEVGSGSSTNATSSSSATASTGSADNSTAVGSNGSNDDNISNSGTTNTIRGGMLCDEMGLGKTLQSITMILDHRPLLQHYRPGVKHPPNSTPQDVQARTAEEQLWKTALTEWKHEMDMNNVVAKLRPKKNLAGARAGTLVVCPVIALQQWKSEIEKFTEPGTLTVGIYHGPNRASELPPAMMSKYDVVLTTYQVLEQDFRKMTSPNKVSCPNCGAKFKIEKLRVHLKYFCGEGAQRTQAQSRQRRTAAHRQQQQPGGSRGGGGGGGGKKKSGGGTKSMTTAAKKTKWASTSQKTKRSAAAAATPPSSRKRKTVRVHGSAKYDSDSELSVLEDDDDDDKTNTTPATASGRPSRSAAITASQKVKSSLQAWTTNTSSRGRNKKKDDDDESSFASSSASSSDDDEEEGSDDNDDSSLSDDEPLAKKPRASSAAAAKRKNNNGGTSSGRQRRGSNRDVERATEKQRQALEAAAATSKRKSGKKPANKGKGKAKGGKGKAKGKGKMAKGKGKKKRFDDDYSSSSSSDESSDGEPSSSDPLAGIDMKELMGEAMDGARFSPLHSFCWWRIILDESHFIKSRSSQTAAAAFALTSVHRWCLSGTPLQNRVSELYSLIRFLRIDPMAYYYCRQKDCNCRSLHYRMVNGTCQGCGHRSFTHYAHFNRYVLNPIQNDGYAGDGRRAMFTLKHQVLDKCLLRRTKETKAADLELPPRLVTLRSIRLHPVEEDFYDALYTQTKSSFDDYIAEGTLLNNYAHIFDLLTKMRQAVNHPYLIVYSKTNVERNRGVAAAAGQQSLAVANGSVDCDMCHEPPTDRVLSTCCGAGFCRSCVVEYITGAGGGENTPCPSCRAPFTIDLNQKTSSAGTGAAAALGDGTLSMLPKAASSSSAATMPSLKELSHVPTGSILRRINLAEFATSSKIEALVQELVEMRKKRPGSKALVFSQFVNMLDLVRWRLHSDPFLAELGLGETKILHGGMDVKSRNETLKTFRENNSSRVLLMSLKSAGVALNLTAASECYILDLWWNPAAEMQAIDRTHRIGQHKPIRAVRFVAEGTVEERVLQLQEKKRLVFDGTIGRDAGSLKMLTAEDMKALFT